MAYPPSTVAADKTDATAIPTDHPDHHNALANAINDTVTELGTSPKGAAATLTARLATLDTTVAAKVPDTGASTIAGVKTFTSDPIVPAEAYGVGWNGSNEPPTKNDTYDKFESLAQLEAGNFTTVDTGTPNFVSIDLVGDIGYDSAKLTSGVTTTGARLATVDVLPACTYANGSSGVGATLTGDAVGQLADIDFTTPAAGDRILVKNQAAPLQNGVYTVTTLGTAGAAFVLTRVTQCDQAADYTNGIFVLVSAGKSNRASLFASSPQTVTMGTTAISWVGLSRPNVTPNDAYLGSNRDRRRYISDFEELDAALVVASGSPQRIPGTPWTVYMVGTGSTVTQVGLSEAVPGCVDLATGTTATGYCAVTTPQVGVPFDTAKPYACFTRMKVPTAWSSAQSFLVRVGAMASIATGAITEGMYFEAPNDGTNWDAVCVTASTFTTVDTGHAPGTGYKLFAVYYDPVAAAATFYINGSLVATITTNLPTNPVISGAAILKDVGTTSRSLRVDLLSIDTTDARNLSKHVVP